MVQPRQSSVHANEYLVHSFTPNVGLVSFDYIDLTQTHWTRPAYPEGRVGSPDANAIHASDAYYGLKDMAAQYGE